MSRALKTAAAVGAVGVVVAFLMGGMILEAAGRLVFGWAGFLGRVLPSVRFSGEGVVLGLACLVLFTGGLHLLLRWLYGEVRQQQTEHNGLRAHWSLRSTACIVAILVLMFVAGIAATGIAHQAGWLIKGRKDLTVARLEIDGPSNRESSSNHLKEMGLGVHNYYHSFNNLPGGVRDIEGRYSHSWLTQLLPYVMSVAGEINCDLPWNHPHNSAYFRSVVPAYLNPEVGALRSPDGYALTHFAGNVRILGSPQPLNFGDLTVGTSHTILGGEAAGAFQPWGEPTNLRDPALGINQDITGFGGPSGSGANMLFFDGSVRFLPKGTQSEILRYSPGSPSTNTEGRDNG